MSQFFSQAGDAPRVESVYAVALYDPKDGIIHHMHHVVSMIDSPKLDNKMAENEAILNAKKVGQNTDNLEIIHIDDIDLASAYRVNVKTKQLEKISLSEISKEGRISEDSSVI